MPSPASIHRISALELWSEHMAMPLSFLSDPMMLDWDAYELSLHNLSKLERESDLAIYITRGETGRITSVRFSSVLNWTLGPECAATIYSPTVDMIISHVVHTLLSADPTWSFVPIFYPISFDSDAAIAALSGLAHQEPSAAYRGGAIVFESSVAVMGEKVGRHAQARL